MQKEETQDPAFTPSAPPHTREYNPHRPASATRLPQSNGIHQAERTPRNRQPRQFLLLPRQSVLPPPHHGSGSRQPDTQLFRQPSRLRLRSAPAQRLPIHLEDGSGRRGVPGAENLQSHQIHERILRVPQKHSERTNRVPPEIGIGCRLRPLRLYHPTHQRHQHLLHQCANEGSQLFAKLPQSIGRFGLRETVQPLHPLFLFPPVVGWKNRLHRPTGKNGQSSRPVLF